jgi:hypothetical protein
LIARATGWALDAGIRRFSGDVMNPLQIESDVLFPQFEARQG